jgi:hypothetical protein
MFVPFLIGGVHRHRHYAGHANSQHRRNFCSDNRKVHWNLCLHVSMGIQTGCCTLVCSELQKHLNDFE